MPVDGQPGDPGLLGERGDRRRRRPDGPVQAHGRLDDAPAGGGDVVGSLAHPVAAGIGIAGLLAHVLATEPSYGYFHDPVLFTEYGEQASPRDHNHTPAPDR